MGNWRIELPPSPKSHVQELTLSVDKSVNVTSRGAIPVVGVPIKSAVGIL